MLRDDPTVASTDSTVAGQSAAAVEPSFQPPRDLGPLELMRELGRGGQSSVWLARHRLLERRVVVKFLRSAASLSPASEQLQLFLEGARAASTLDHPNLNRILHADIAEGVPYIVTDFVDGQSLAHVLRTQGSLTLAETATVLLDVCEALAVLHSADILHRDIKPGNVLISGDGRAILTDFGLSGWTRGDAEGPVAGTPRYMAPECFEGRFSPRTDVYAVGLIARELLTGETGTDGSWPTTPPLRTRRTTPSSTQEQTHKLDTDVLPADRKTAPLVSMISAFFGSSRRRSRPQLGPTQTTGGDDSVLSLLAKSHGDSVAQSWQEITSRCTNENPVLRFKSAAQLLDALRRAAQSDVSVPAGRDRLARRLRVVETEAAAPRASMTVSEPSQFHDRLKKFISRVDRPQPKPAPTGVAAGQRLDQFAAAGLVGAEVPCVVCRYSLAGQHMRQRCPECGTAIETSVDPQRFWFRTVRSIRVMVIAQSVFLAVGAVFLVLRSLNEWSERLGNAWWVTAFMPVMGLVCVLCVWVFVLCWQPARPAGARWISRVAAWLPPLVAASFLLMPLFREVAQSRPTTSSLLDSAWGTWRSFGPMLMLAALAVYQWLCLTDYFGSRVRFHLLLWSAASLVAFPIWTQISGAQPAGSRAKQVVDIVGILFLPFALLLPIMQIAVLVWFRRIRRAKSIGVTTGAS